MRLADLSVSAAANFSEATEVRMGRAFVLAAAILGCLGVAPVAASAATGEGESPGVRAELSQFVRPSGPLVSPRDNLGGQGSPPAPQGGTLVEAYSTPTAKTYQMPNGLMVTQVQATPLSTSVSSSGPPPLGPEPFEPSCTLSSAAPTTSSCNQTTFLTGYDTTLKGAYRGLLEFPLTNLIPKSVDPEILSSQLAVYLASSTTTNATSVGAYRVTSEWAPGATWNTTNGTTAWKTSGGDFSTGSDGAINPSVGASTGWVFWHPTQDLQEWYDGPSVKEGASNFGVLLKDVSEGAVNNVLTFEANKQGNPPILKFTWVPRGIGIQPQFTTLPIPVDNQTSLRVNVASGDLAAAVDALQVPGTGPAMEVTDTWNSLGGLGWSEQLPQVLDYSEGAVYYRNPEGTWFPFVENEKNFITPPGIKAILCGRESSAPCSAPPSGDQYRLIYDQSHLREDFGLSTNKHLNAGNYRMDVRDRFENAITFGQVSEAGEQVATDTRGHHFAYQWQFPEHNEPFLYHVTDEAGSRKITYFHESAEHGPYLTGYVNAAGEETNFRYGTPEANGFKPLEEIKTPKEQSVLTLTYDSEKRVTEIARRLTSESRSRTRFKYYEPGNGTKPAGCTTEQKATVVIDPDGVQEEEETKKEKVGGPHTTTYCANLLDEVEKTVDGEGNETSATFDALANDTSLTAPPRESGASRGVTSFVYLPGGVNLGCEVEGLTAQQTECPKKALAEGYSSGSEYKDENYPFQATEEVSPREPKTERLTTTLCYYGGTAKCNGTERGEEVGSSGAVRRVTDPLLEHSTTYYSYNSNGTVKFATDPDGNTTSYLYNSIGELTGIVPPTGAKVGQTTIEPDADGRPHVVTQCLEETKEACKSTETATLTYNNLDQVTEATYAGPSSTKTFKYTYDGDGNLVRREDPSGTTTFTIDPLNRLTKEELPGGLSNSYGYDRASNLTSFMDAGGTTMYFYNGLNQLEAMYEPGGRCSGTPAKCTTFSYDKAGSLTKITYPSGASLKYKLDATTGRPVTIEADNPNGARLASNSYKYKEYNNEEFTESGHDTPLIYQDESSLSGVTKTTRYYNDELDRLVAADTTTTPATKPASCYTYHYDGTGNRTAAIHGIGEGCKEEQKTYARYNSGNELECRVKTQKEAEEACSSVSESEKYTTYSYDGAGNETGITGHAEPGNTTFSYNNLNQLEHLTPPGGSELTLKYLGSGQNNLTALGSKTLQNSTLGITQQTSESKTSYYARTPEGQLIDERLPNGQTYNPVYDAQGNIIGLLNTTGALVQTITYGPYGENATATKNGNNGAEYSTTNDPFMFQGGYHTEGAEKGEGNAPNGLYHFGERYYDPTTGRWTQPDPEGVEGYNFAGDDPVNASDPSGERINGPPPTPHSCIVLWYEAEQYERRKGKGPGWTAKQLVLEAKICKVELGFQYNSEERGTRSGYSEAAGQRLRQALSSSGEYRR